MERLGSRNLLTTGQEMERKVSGYTLRSHGHDNGMASVVSARATSAYVSFGGEDVDELSLALISPLSSQHDTH